MQRLKLVRIFREHGDYLAWSVAVIATMGSLYFSEVKGYIPCNFCWYQRILMYPLVIILGIAAVRKDERQSVYVSSLAMIGWLIAAVHYLMQKTSLFQTLESGCGIIPCAGEYINWYGFITIPFLSLVAFTLIIILQILTVWARKQQ